jgi:hypothetical protein
MILSTVSGQSCINPSISIPRLCLLNEALERTLPR